MVFAALVAWLLAVVFTSYGLQHLWTPARENRFLAVLLAPGLIVHEMSHVLACLLTGATVNHVSLFERGTAGKVTHTRPAVPLVGQALISLAPLGGCGAALWFLARGLLRPVGRQFTPQAMLPGQLVRLDVFAKYAVDVIRQTFDAVLSADFTDWRTYLFAYLSVVLVVHLAPSRQDLRNGVAGLVVGGVLLFAAAQVWPTAVMGGIRGLWPFLTLSLALALFALAATLAALGLVRLGRLMLRPG